MAPNKQKVIAPKQPGRRLGRPRKTQTATPTPGPTTTGIKLKVKLNKGVQEDARSPVSAYQFPLSAPPSDYGPEKEGVEVNTTLNVNEQGTRRGARQRTKTHAPDMVFGSEMDMLMSSATIAKMDDEDHAHMVSSPPTTISMRPPKGHDFPALSSPTAQCLHSPSPQYAGSVDEAVYDIVNTLHSSPDIQIDLPNMWAPGTSRVVKPYTASFLTQLYIQCYESHLWHFCDLIADTWIRALQKANKRSHKSQDERDHMWRKNVALERMFREKKKGFKKDAFEFRLDVQDPDMDDDVTDFNTERLQLLYNHTDPKCGARLLWADAMALCGRKMENNISKRPGVWPQELFYDVMCTGLRMVGRKLTLKIEEKYEGAWCKYHEHVKHGLPCYRELAWQQKCGQGEDEDHEEMEVNMARAEERVHDAGNADEQSDAKRVRFDADEVTDVGGYADLGDIDAEGESEED